MGKAAIRFVFPVALFLLLVAFNVRTTVTLALWVLLLYGVIYELEKENAELKARLAASEPKQRPWGDEEL